MEINKNLYSKDQLNMGLDFKINLTVVGIFLFTFFFSITKSFVPFEITFLILLFSITILIFNRLISKNGIILTRVDFLWFLFYILFVLNITLNNLFNLQTIVDIMVYASALFFLVLVKVNIDYYKSSMKLIVLLGIVYAISAIFHYIFTDEYLNFILPLFNVEEQTEILRLLKGNTYTGLTNQTAYLAGYTLSAIGIVFFSKRKDKYTSKITTSLLLIVLFTGLLLSGKRAHLIFMIIAILVTYIFSINNKRIVKHIFRLLSGILAVLLIVIMIYNFSSANDDSPIINFINELEYTIVGLLEGEDVSSGRTVLYSHSWKLFKEKPITGIGWREFRENSLGLINSDRGSHPHNIYLQLLTELGIVGFLLFMFPVVYVYYKTFHLLRILSLQSNSFINWKNGIQFSFFIQTFSLLYGLTGNTLTDYNFLLLYFFASSITLSALVRLKISNSESF